MKLYEADAPDIIQAMDKLAQEKGYGKILAKVPGSLSSVFEQCGYREEAAIPGFSRGAEDIVFMGKYFSPERRLEKHQDFRAEKHPQNPAGCRLQSLDGRNVGADNSDAFGKPTGSFID